jgi:hypothetical protein
MVAPIPPILTDSPCKNLVVPLGLIPPTFPNVVPLLLQDLCPRPLKTCYFCHGVVWPEEPNQERSQGQKSSDRDGPPPGKFSFRNPEVVKVLGHRWSDLPGRHCWEWSGEGGDSPRKRLDFDLFWFPGFMAF